MMMSSLISSTSRKLFQNSRGSNAVTRILGNHGIMQQQQRYVNIDVSSLPAPPKPKANYNIVCYTSGNMMFISGHLPIKPDGTLLTGKIGMDTIEQGYEAARYAGLNMISTMNNELGDLKKVKKVLKVCVRCFILLLFVVYSHIIMIMIVY